MRPVVMVAIGLKIGGDIARGHVTQHYQCMFLKR